jgi:hypothetical protein
VISSSPRESSKPSSSHQSYGQEQEQEDRTEEQEQEEIKSMNLFQRNFSLQLTPMGSAVDGSPNPPHTTLSPPTQSQLQQGEGKAQEEPLQLHHRDREQLD